MPGPDPQSDPTACRSDSPQGVRGDRSVWPALHAGEWIPIVLAVSIPTAIAVLRLPPGICFGDSGDLQLASATLGIAHPPGYPLLSSMGFLLTRIPFVDPAYVISLACAVSGAVAAYLCGLMQVRLGVHSLIAGAGAALFLAHPRVWFNMVAPEVYMPSLAMLVGAVYCFMRYAATDSMRHFYAAALLFGAALFTRPPTLFSLPFLLLAVMTLAKGKALPWKRTAARIGTGVMWIALPGLYSFGYVLVRDHRDAPYNYIEVHNEESGALPEVTGGPAARLERAVWLMTGKQFAQDMGATWPQIRSKMNWIRHNAIPVDGPIVIPIVVLAVAGLVVSCSRNRATALVLVGLMVQTIVFVCVYRVHGQAANLLPLLASAMVFLGLAVNAALAVLSGGRRTVVAAMVAILGVAGAAGYLLRRGELRGLFDATKATLQADVATLPPDSVIISAWDVTTPLRYAHYYAARADVHIATISPARWVEFAGRFGGRPVFVPRLDERINSVYRATPFRNLYRLEPWPAESPSQNNLGGRAL